MTADRPARPLADQVRRWGAYAASDGAWRYERICNGIAADPELLALLYEAPPAQRRPNILLAAVHHLLLLGEQDPLALHYPTVLAWRGVAGDAGVAGPGTDPFPAFAAFCRRHRERLADLVATRATQTNEIGRCAALLPALVTVAARVRRPLALLDLGTSAGLTLLFDRYGYDYGAVGTAGVSGSPVRLRCEVRGGTPPLDLPPVAGRAGLDHAPVDVADDRAALWLLACQWPDHLDRFATMRAAIELARRDVERPALLTGDMVRDLGDAVRSVPDDAEAHLCVVHSWTAAYLEPGAQRALAAAVATVAETRPCSWLFAEEPSEVPGLPMPPPPTGTRVRGATAVVLASYDHDHDHDHDHDQHHDHDPDDGSGAAGGGPLIERLADMHAHGRWLHWYGAPTAPS